MALVHICQLIHPTRQCDAIRSQERQQRAKTSQTNAIWQRICSTEFRRTECFARVKFEILCGQLVTSYVSSLKNLCSQSLNLQEPKWLETIEILILYYFLSTMSPFEDIFTYLIWANDNWKRHPFEIVHMIITTPIVCSPSWKFTSFNWVSCCIQNVQLFWAIHLWNYLIHNLWWHFMGCNPAFHGSWLTD